MLDFATPHSTYEPVGENRGRFIVEPLARGFGYTFGNSLRRVLLSSLEGAAISSVKITGVEHEFSTVPHVKEDVTDIILNLKRIVFVLHGEADDHEVTLVKDGPGTVTAADIQLPSAVEVMDPGAYIANLEDWYEDLGPELTPRTWFNGPSELPDDGRAFVLKGRTNSR